MCTGIKSVRCESTVGECTYRYFVAADVSGTFNPDENRFAGVHVEYLRCKSPANKTDF